MKQTQSKAKPMDLGRRTNEEREHVIKREEEKRGWTTHCEKTVAFPSCAIHLDPIPTEFLNLANGYIRSHQPGEHRVDAEEDLREEDEEEERSARVEGTRDRM